MPAFLEDISAFYGTGQSNEKGQSLEEFLAEYDPYKYKNPCCTTDAVVFSKGGCPDKDLTGLKVLMVQRKNHPSIGCWALPGGFVNLYENLEDTARRELEEETGVKGLALEQLGAYGDYNRDPRARVITTAYMALVDERDVKVRAGDDAAQAAWCEVSLELAEKTVNKDVEEKLYRICLKNGQYGVDTHALVKYTCSGKWIQEKKCSVVERGMTAADHAAILLQALLTLQERAC